MYFVEEISASDGFSQCFVELILTIFYAILESIFGLLKEFV